MKPRLSLKGRALQLLAQREQSGVELRRKLTAHAQAERAAAEADALAGPAERGGEVADVPDVFDQVDAVLAWLEANQFSSDERFAESRVHARAARFGNLRIRSELAQHGLAVGAEQAQQLEESEFDRAWQVWLRKFGDAAVASGADRQAAAAAQWRQSRFLAGRGFTPEVIRKVLRDAARR